MASVASAASGGRVIRSGGYGSKPNQSGSSYYVGDTNLEVAGSGRKIKFAQFICNNGAGLVYVTTDKRFEIKLPRGSFRITASATVTGLLGQFYGTTTLKLRGRFTNAAKTTHSRVPVGNAKLAATGTGSASVCKPSSASKLRLYYLGKSHGK